MSYDLREEQWIPCLTRQGKPKAIEVGIRQALLQAHELREIGDTSPLVTAALHRLLLAILYRCFPSLGQEDDAALSLWETLWTEEKGFPADAVNAYLDSDLVRNRFDLFSPTHPFFQIGGLQVLEEKKGKKPIVTEFWQPLGRLAAEVATGNNATLFDHSSDEAPAAHSPAQAARWLVAAQCFSLNGGKSKDAHVAGRVVARPYSENATAAKSALMWLSGDSLFQTLLLNLKPTALRLGDKPCWERTLEEELELGERSKGDTRFAGPLDRWTHLSRWVRLRPEEQEGRDVMRWMFITQGRSVDVKPEDPMCLYVVPDKSKPPRPFAVDKHKATWRDAHSLLAVQAPSAEEKKGTAPAALDNAALFSQEGIIKREFTARLNVVGMVVESSAKVVLWRHDRFPLPVAFLEQTAGPDKVARLGILLKEAEDLAAQIEKHLRDVCVLLLSPYAGHPLKPGASSPKAKQVSVLLQRFDTRASYWARVEEHFDRLMLDLASAQSVDELEAVADRWCQSIEREATRALEAALDGIGTTRRDALVRRALAKVPARLRTRRTQSVLSAQKKLKGKAKSTKEVKA